MKWLPAFVSINKFVYLSGMIAQPPKHLNTISIHFRFELNFRFNLDRYHTSILAVIFSGQAAYGRQITRVSLSLLQIIYSTSFYYFHSEKGSDSIRAKLTKQR